MNTNTTRDEAVENLRRADEAYQAAQDAVRRAQRALEEADKAVFAAQAEYMAVRARRDSDAYPVGTPVRHVTSGREGVVAPNNGDGIAVTAGGLTRTGYNADEWFPIV